MSSAACPEILRAVEDPGPPGVVGGVRMIVNLAEISPAHRSVHAAIQRITRSNGIVVDALHFARRWGIVKRELDNILNR